ncbi:MAG: hypothetical protein IKP62_03870 [Salinivirgaceae bacterium]|nr:hypothetical protein [Salinivirgaceae bacterium]
MIKIVVRFNEEGRFFVVRQYFLSANATYLMFLIEVTEIKKGGQKKDLTAF